jgi:hypothetical protein
MQHGGENMRSIINNLILLSIIAGFTYSCDETISQIDRRLLISSPAEAVVTADSRVFSVNIDSQGFALSDNNKDNELAPLKGSCVETSHCFYRVFCMI